MLTHLSNIRWPVDSPGAREGHSLVRRRQEDRDLVFAALGHPVHDVEVPARTLPWRADIQSLDNPQSSDVRCADFVAFVVDLEDKMTKIFEFV